MSYLIIFIISTAEKKNSCFLSITEYIFEENHNIKSALILVFQTLILNYTSLNLNGVSFVLMEIFMAILTSGLN